jgi:predicted nucleic acid-binding Zn ribbon protein
MAQRGEAPLRRVLDGVLDNLGAGTRFREHLALMAWERVAGRVVASHSRAEAARDGVLIVATDTPAWAQELGMRRKDLLDRLASEVGDGVIRDIHFRSGLRRARRAAPRRPRPAEMKLSGRQERRAVQAAAVIEDEDLRARAERAFAALARMREWRRRTGWHRCRRCGRWQRVGRWWCASCRRAGGRRWRRRR